MSGGIMRFEEETEQMKLGFLAWVNLGKGRTYRRVAASLKVDEATVGYWAKYFKWGERLDKMKDEGHLVNTPSRLALNGLIPPSTADSTQRRLGHLADRLEAFVERGAENLQLALDAGLVLDTGALVKLIKEYRETLIAHRRGGATANPAAAKIDNLTVILNNMSQEDQIALFTHGQITLPDVGGRNQPATAGSQEADYDEIPDGRVEDAVGRGGVPGGAGGGEGGDEGELSSGCGPGAARVSLLRFE